MMRDHYDMSTVPHSVAARSSRRTWLASLASACVLAACAAPRPYVLRQGIWCGRIALNTEEERPQSFSAEFALRGSPQQGELEVYNPLGNIIARLRWSPHQALLDKGAEQIAGDSLDALVAQVFGAPIPIAALFDWLSGHARQEPGWQVDLSRYGQGRIHALREQPLPRASLRVILHADDSL